MRTYNTTIWPYATIVFIGIAAMVLIGYTGRDTQTLFLKGIVIFSSAPVASVILFGYGTYIKIVGDDIQHVQLVVLRKKTPISSITHITQEGTYYVLSSIMKSLYVYYANENGKERCFHFSLALYDGKTLQRLLKDLLEINPDIVLDKKTEKFLRTSKTG